MIFAVAEEGGKACSGLVEWAFLFSNAKEKRLHFVERNTTFEKILHLFLKMADFIYQNVKYPEAFANDLLKSLRAIAGNGSIQPWLDCLSSWEATAELDATPQTRKRILKAYADLKDGKIKTTPSLKAFLEIVNAE